MSEEKEAKYLAIIEQKDRQIAELQEKLSLVLKRMFGAQSEKLDARQLELLLRPDSKKDEPAGGTAPALKEKPSPSPSTRRDRRPRLPEHLPVEEEVVIPLDVQAEPEAWRLIGEEVTERLDYRPARYLRKRLVRRKFVSIKEPLLAPVIAPLPPSLQDRCLAAPAMIAHVITAKYCDHLPLYRQEDILWRRHRIPLPRQTMMGWLDLAEFWLRPIYEWIRTTVMEGNYVQVDETPIRYLCPGHGKTKLGYLWTASRPGMGTFFHWETGRGAECLERVVPKEFGGTLQCDGYAVYPAFVRHREARMDLAGCWAHVRRKFYEAKEAEPRRAGWILHQIGLLYRVEEQLRRKGAGPGLREAVRASQSRGIVQRIGKVLRCWMEQRRFRPKSAMGLAVAYTLGLWNQLNGSWKTGLWK